MKNIMNNPKINAIVTGGAGFIGSELVRQLASHGHDVVAVDNLVNGKKENLSELSTDRVRLEVADIRDLGLMKELMKNGCDVIFQLASLGVRHSIHSPVENHDVNATATLNLLQIARENGVHRFVYVSTSEVYGTARSVPMSEDHPTLPHTVYGASKLAGECYTRAFHSTYGYPTVVIRPFNAFGPRCHHEGDSGEVIPKFMLRCLANKPMVVFGDGTQTRDFTYVEDTARGIFQIGMSDDAIGRTINLGSNREISINALADKIQSIVGPNAAGIQHDKPRPGDVLRLYANATMAKDVVGFSPKIGLTEGLTRLRDWYLNMGVPIEKLLEQETIRNWE